MPGQISEARAVGDTLYVRAEFPGGVRDRAISMIQLLNSKEPATFLACEIELAMLDPKPETSNVD